RRRPWGSWQSPQGLSLFLGGGLHSTGMRVRRHGGLGSHSWGFGPTQGPGRLFCHFFPRDNRVFFLQGGLGVSAPRPPLPILRRPPCTVVRHWRKGKANGRVVLPRGIGSDGPRRTPGPAPFHRGACPGGGSFHVRTASGNLSRLGSEREAQSGAGRPGRCTARQGKHRQQIHPALMAAAKGGGHACERRELKHFSFER